ncbi:MAG: efflux RND transporter periplasmic adaptor subunit [Acidobacteria bacterium]|nr:efflux RND transporter periplasmic adaptor subunit [Acidobacteriota bacterium]
MSLGSSNLTKAKQEHDLEPTPGVSKTPFVAVGFLLVVLLVIGVIPRLKRHSELATAAQQQEHATSLVETVTPRQSEATNELVLPATTQAIQEIIVAARTSGYVRRWLVGIGQPVKAGQLLAEIDVPETNQMLREAQQEIAEANQTVAQGHAELAQAEAGLQQSEAQLKQARTNLELARVNLDRSKTLSAQGVVSRQDTDDKQAIYDARLADVEAAQAAVRSRQSAIKAQQATIDARVSSSSAREATAQRFADLQSFQKVVAPFDGIVTARYIEVGTLITPSGGTANQPGLYKVSRLDTIRVFVNVPQSFAPAVNAGLETEIIVKELAPRKYTGKVIGTTHSIDTTSRTMLAEIRVPNPDHQFLPGMYAQVKFTLPTLRRSVLIPAAALVVNAAGTQAIIVRPDQTIHYQPVEVGRDFGKEVEIVSGLDGSEALISTPSDALHEGMRVQVSQAHK